MGRIFSAMYVTLDCTAAPVCGATSSLTDSKTDKKVRPSRAMFLVDVWMDSLFYPAAFFQQKSLFGLPCMHRNETKVRKVASRNQAFFGCDSYVGFFVGSIV